MKMKKLLLLFGLVVTNACFTSEILKNMLTRKALEAAHGTAQAVADNLAGRVADSSGNGTTADRQLSVSLQRDLEDLRRKGYQVDDAAFRKEIAEIKDPFNLSRLEDLLRKRKQAGFSALHPELRVSYEGLKRDISLLRAMLRRIDTTSGSGFMPKMLNSDEKAAINTGLINFQDSLDRILAEDERIVNLATDQFIAKGAVQLVSEQRRIELEAVKKGFASYKRFCKGTFNRLKREYGNSVAEQRRDYNATIDRLRLENSTAAQNLERAQQHIATNHQIEVDGLRLQLNQHQTVWPKIATAVGITFVAVSWWHSASGREMMDAGFKTAQNLAQKAAAKLPWKKRAQVVAQEAAAVGARVGIRMAANAAGGQ